MMFRVYNSSPSLVLFLLITLGKIVLSERKSWPHREFSSKFKDADKDDVPRRPDGKIIFPSNGVEDVDLQNSSAYDPICNHSTFCEDASNYPDNAIDVALRMHKGLAAFSSVDGISDDVVHRMGESDDDNPLCESYEKVVFPKAAKSKNNKWFFVVNQENFKQGVRVELCVEENSACDMFDGFYEGYKTMCKQKYIYRQLVAVSRTGRVKPETFRFPSSCCCHVKFTGNPSIRMGPIKYRKSKFEIGTK